MSTRAHVLVLTDGTYISVASGQQHGVVIGKAADGFAARMLHCHP